MPATRNRGDRHAVISEVRRGSPSQTTVDHHRQLVLHPLSISHTVTGQLLCMLWCVYCRRQIASTHGDHTIRITSVQTGKCTHVLEGHPRTPWCIAFHPSSSNILASGCLAGEVRIWDLKVMELFPISVMWYST